MTPAGMAIIGILLAFLWITALYAAHKGRKKHEKDVKAIEENPQKYLADNLGNGVLGGIYRGARRMDAAVERTTRPAEEFYGLVHCPSCSTFAFHYIDRYTKKHVVRQCVNDKCNKKWKQIR